MMRLLLRTSGLMAAGWIATRIVAAPAPIPSAPATAPAPLKLSALDPLEMGLWQLDVKGKAPRLICVTDPVALTQVEHDQPACSRFVIANDAKSATVHYSCQRAGWGRTTVRVETARLASIQTQGIARNAPFDYVIEARRIGVCGDHAAAKPR